MLLVRILPIPLMMLRLSLTSNISIWLGLNPLVWIQADQKIAQFKKDSQSWNELLSEIRFHADISPDKETADKENDARYEKLAREIVTLRNQRIESSKALIRGFILILVM